MKRTIRQTQLRVLREESQLAFRDGELGETTTKETTIFGNTHRMGLSRPLSLGK